MFHVSDPEYLVFLIEEKSCSESKDDSVKFSAAFKVKFSLKVVFSASRRTEILLKGRHQNFFLEIH